MHKKLFHPCLFVSLFCLFSFPVNSAQALEDIPVSAAQRYEAALVSGLETTLSARVSGFIEKVHVKEGQTFKQGDILVKLDCKIHEADRKRTVAEIRGAKATLASKQKLKELKSASNIDVTLAEVEVEKLQADLQGIDETIKGCAIKAPVDAVATEVHINDYQTVNQRDPLITLTAQNSINVEFFVPSTESSRIEVGHNVQLFVNETKQRYTVTISAIVPRIDPVSQTFKVIGELKSKKNKLLPGMTGSISISGL